MSNTEETVIHNEFSSYQEIEEAVKAGKPVFWANSLYVVECWETPNELHVVCTSNKHTVGLNDNQFDIERCFILKNGNEE